LILPLRVVLLLDIPTIGGALARLPGLDALRVFVTAVIDKLIGKFNRCFQLTSTPKVEMQFVPSTWPAQDRVRRSKKWSCATTTTNKVGAQLYLRPLKSRMTPVDPFNVCPWSTYSVWWCFYRSVSPKKKFFYGHRPVYLRLPGSGHLVVKFPFLTSK
jgi:hypothetical protein